MASGRMRKAYSRASHLSRNGPGLSRVSASSRTCDGVSMRRSTLASVFSLAVAATVGYLGTSPERNKRLASSIEHSAVHPSRWTGASATSTSRPSPYVLAKITTHPRVPRRVSSAWPPEAGTRVPSSCRFAPADGGALRRPTAPKAYTRASNVAPRHESQSRCRRAVCLGLPFNGPSTGHVWFAAVSSSESTSPCSRVRGG